MVVNQAYDKVAMDLLNRLNGHLQESVESKDTLENFLSSRVKIKSLQHTIVSMHAKKVQLLHQKTKEDAIAKGKKPRFLLLKSRRMGMTTWEQAISYRAVVSKRNTTCVTLADNKENTKTIFRMVNLMAKLDSKLEHRTNDSKVSLEIPSINTYFHIGTAGSRSFSRGDNLYRVHGSEVAWWPGDSDTISNLVAGLSEAARHGEMVFETTANGSSGWYYENYAEAMEGGNQWIPLFYPWYLDPENVLTHTDEEEEEVLSNITDQEQNLMDEYGLIMGQILWRRDKKKELKKLFTQEYPENWTEAFLVRGHTFFDQGMLSELMKQVMPVINERESLTVWEKPQPNGKYVLGADPAEGNAKSDNSVCAVLNKETGNQAAVLRGKWRPEVFARKCVELAKHYNNGYYACEINNHGHSVMNTVVNTLHYRHLYYHLKSLDRDKFGKNKKEKRPGWQTNAATRPVLLDELNEALEEGFMQVNDTVFIAECKTFVDNGGKYEADKNQKDDSVIAWGIAWQARKQLKSSFNIV